MQRSAIMGPNACVKCLGFGSLRRLPVAYQRICLLSRDCDSVFYIMAGSLFLDVKFDGLVRLEV